MNHIPTNVLTRFEMARVVDHQVQERKESSRTKTGKKVNPKEMLHAKSTFLEDIVQKRQKELETQLATPCTACGERPPAENGRRPPRLNSRHDHIAERGYDSMDHNGLVPTPIPSGQRSSIIAGLERIAQVRAKADVIREAQNKKDFTAFATLMDLCHPKR